jgi:hypothetical protein
MHAQLARSVAAPLAVALTMALSAPLAADANRGGVPRTTKPCPAHKHTGRHNGAGHGKKLGAGRGRKCGLRW